MIRINYQPSPWQLAVFGLVWLVLLGIIGAAVLRQSGSVALAGVVWVLAVGVPALGWLVPAMLRILYVGLSLAAFPLGWLVSHLVLAIVYYLVLTPTGLLLRLFGHDALHRRFDRSAASYWCGREPTADRSRYFRQF